ncbi:MULTISPECIES: hypothetical protein [unclassified Streptomyces]|uniref:hypothetical protein n=1 Tax=unclassified Streptomyces TaxID=2593676 RepID=UPI00278BEC79|nr:MULTISPECIES: hypothetical protein [unclassified Streptomyces]
MANPGYGKRSVPDQLPRTGHDFTHLPAREAHIAGFIDRLPDGSDISVKLLASCLPYGQAAMGTALNNLQAAGHLRRGREHLAGSGSSRWVTRSWFSRTARDDAWWTAYVRGDVPQETPDEPARKTPPTRSRALVLLTALGRTAPSLALSAAECEQLAPAVEQWFAHGAEEPGILHALTAGLPVPVHSPAALVRRRLTDKLPPPPAPRPPLRVLECATCGAPGRPESLQGGKCAPCRGTHPDRRPAAPLTPEAVRARAAEARAAMIPRSERTRV